MGDNFGIQRAGVRSGNNADDNRTQGQILSDFLMQLEDYTPTVGIEASDWFNVLTRF